MSALYSNFDRITVLSDIDDERDRQDKRWGEQNHPDGTSATREHFATSARRRADINAKDGSLTWLDILQEETQEAFAETDPDNLREELVQCGAVIVAWIEAIDRRKRG